MNNKESLECTLNRILYTFVCYTLIRLFKKSNEKVHEKNEYFFKAVFKQIYFPASFPIICFRCVINVVGKFLNGVR